MVENEEKKALLQVVHVPVISADAAAVVVEIPHLPPEYTSIIGFKRSSFREIVFYALCMITGGILGLISKWYLPLRCHISRIPCSSFRDADYVLVKAPGGNMSEIEIKRIELPDNYMSLLNRGAKTRSARYFDFRKQRYLYKESQSSFQRLDTKLSKQFAQLHDMRHGVSSAEASFLIQFHGANSITIEVEPIYKMLMEKVFHPFYIFQLVSVVVWMTEMYYTYSIVIIAMSVSSIAWEVYSAKVNETNLRSLAKTEDQVRVLRDGLILTIDTKKLVVGDAVILNNSDSLNGTFKPALVVCDMVIVQGDTVIVDESSLTGESIPVVKAPVPVMESHDEAYSSEKHKRHTLYSGSTITHVKMKPQKQQKDVVDDVSSQNQIGTEDLSKYAIGIVVSTGFYSSKGELLRSILFPKPIDFKFYRDSYVFIGMLSIVALSAFINNLIDGLNESKGFLEVLVSSIDLVTIAVPPALPLVLTVGIGIAIGRLRKSKIFCIDPERINFAGSVDVVCWDKTGTLTLSGLSWVGIEPASDGVFIGFRESSSPPPPTASNVQEGALPEDARQIAKLGYLRKCLATCHGVNYIGGEISGHMVDMEMFKSTGWSFAVASEGNSAEDNANLSTIMLGQHKLDVVVKLVDSSSSIPNLAPAALYVVKRFEFDAAIQRNTVVCIEPNSIKSDNSGDILVFSKGSPEAIKNVCKPKSVPAKFHAIYQHYAAKGFYVLACAYKILNPDTSGSDFSQQSISTIRREKMEKDLTFLGFFILQNPIKPESFPTLNALSNADIRSVIITGDNSLTAIHVARELKLCQTVLMVEMSKNGSNELVFWQVPNDAHHPLAATTNDLGNKNGGSSNRLDVAAAGNSAGVSKPRASTLAAGIFSSMSTDDNTEMFPIEELPPYLLASKNQTDIAISGVALERLQDMYGQGFADWIICRSRIFSRAKPNHKTWIVERLQAEKFVVAMCGDGTNDCGALKAANVGLALSDAEASLVAPFTSARKLISDVPILLAEGRCALETSFISFKYMILYPIIQLSMTATLYHLDTALGNNQFLFDDLILVLLAALFMLYTGPSKRLAAVRPSDSLLSPQILVSIGGQIAICVSFFFIQIAILNAQPWFCSADTAISQLDGSWNPINATAPLSHSYPCYMIDKTSDVQQMFHVLISTYENTAIWLFSHMQFIGVALSLSIYSSHRLPIWTNIPYTLYLLLSSCGVVWLFFINSEGDAFLNWVSQQLNLRSSVPLEYRFWICVMAIGNIVCCCLWEWLVVGLVVTPWILRQQGAKRSKDAFIRARSAGIVGTVALVNHTTGVKVGSHGLQRSASREMMNNEGRESVSPDGRPLTATDRGASNSNRRLDFAFFEMGEQFGSRGALFSTSTVTSRGPFRSYLENVKQNVKEISAADLQKKLSADPLTHGPVAPLHLLDVRETYEWNNGHIPNAIYTGRGCLERDVEGLVPDITDEIVVYCAGGVRSILAADALQKMGYKNVSSLAGGIGKWKTSGYFTAQAKTFSD